MRAVAAGGKASGWISLAVLAIPTALLASAPDLTVFTLLRVAQGLCMASAFALTLAYLGEQCSATDAGGAFAAYITGNVASNLIGRLVSAGIAAPPDTHTFSPDVSAAPASSWWSIAAYIVGTPSNTVTASRWRMASALPASKRGMRVRVPPTETVALSAHVCPKA